MAKNSASANKKKPVPKDLHVVHHPEGWIIRNEGSYRVCSRHKTQREAIETALVIAEQRFSTLVIHSLDGSVRERKSFRRDPLPPPKPPKVLFPTTPPRNASRDEIRRAVLKVIEERRNQELKEKTGFPRQ